MKLNVSACYVGIILVVIIASFVDAAPARFARFNRARFAGKRQPEVGIPSWNGFQDGYTWKQILENAAAAQSDNADADKADDGGDNTDIKRAFSLFSQLHSAQKTRALYPSHQNRQGRLMYQQPLRFGR